MLSYLKNMTFLFWTASLWYLCSSWPGPDPSTLAQQKSVDTCLFDAEKIYQQIEYLEVVGPSLTSRGNFIWKNAEQDSEVRWIPDKKGKWDVSWVPPNDVGINKKRPPNQELLVAGCDPFDHDVTTDGRR